MVLVGTDGVEIVFIRNFFRSEFKENLFNFDE